LADHPPPPPRGAVLRAARWRRGTDDSYFGYYFRGQPVMNRHPVDRMADIKAEIAILEEEYAALRRGVVDGSIGLVGAEWTARVDEHVIRHITIRDAERCLPPETFERLAQMRQQMHVTLSKIHK
jgi:hypothetical protein